MQCAHLKCLCGPLRGPEQERSGRWGEFGLHETVAFDAFCFSGVTMNGSRLHELISIRYPGIWRMATGSNSAEEDR